MTEAWMIADKNSLKEEIGTDKDDNELNSNFPLKSVESIADPKGKITEVIRMACINNPSRLDRINISDLSTARPKFRFSYSYQFERE